MVNGVPDGVEDAGRLSVRIDLILTLENLREVLFKVFPVSGGRIVDVLDYAISNTKFGEEAAKSQVLFIVSIG